MKEQGRCLNLAQIDRTHFDRIQAYLDNAQHYYKNSLETLRKKEFGKAGELLWGSIAETTKALHLQYYDRPIDSHGNIRGFLNDVASTYNEINLKNWIRSANDLHVNFYETNLNEEEFMETYEDGVDLFAFLSSLLGKPRKHVTSKKRR